MKLLESLKCNKGLTLNAQLVDLLLILDGPGTPEEKDAKIEAYIQELGRTQEEYLAACDAGHKFEFTVDKIIDLVPGISPEQRESLKKIYLENLEGLAVCDKKHMMQVLKEKGFDPELHSEIASRTRPFMAKEGILSLTPEDVRNYYTHLFEGGNRYDRATFDNVGKYSGYVSFDGETYTPQEMQKMIAFCQDHGMKSKVNTLFFYADFPKVYESFLKGKEARGEISFEDMKRIFKERLIGYVQDIAQRIGDQIDCVDIFNELIYDPIMKEEGFDERPTFHPRETGWSKYLNIEDLCEMALAARKAMPNVTFTYNDMNWVNPDKRKEIIKIVQEIQKIEARYRAEGKLGEKETLIDTIGIEAHLTTDVDLDEIDRTFDEIRDQIGLPIEVTEFDVARTGADPLSTSEIKKQGMVFERFLSHQERIEYFTTWSQNDNMSFMNDKCQSPVYASVLDASFQEKEFESTREFVAQDFNFHTHTELCGHAFGTMEEYVEHAIAGGIKTLGFSDHTPALLGPSAKNHEMSLEDFTTQYIPMLKDLRDKYAGQIDIYFGLETEYLGDALERLTLENMPESLAKFKGILEHFINVKQTRESSLDYLILGQHTTLKRDEDCHLLIPPQNSPKNSASYPMDYALTVVEAIKSGKFAYIAHPDIFLEARDSVAPENREKYLENALEASRLICEAAAEHHIPLEVNLGSIAAIEGGQKSKLSDGTYPYPVPSFWEIAKVKGCEVLIGIDAHTPDPLKDKTMEMIAKEMLEHIGLEYMTEFKPKGIGKEGKEDKEDKKQEAFTSKDVGKAFADRPIDRKDVATSKVDAVAQSVEKSTQETSLDDNE